MFTCKIKPAAPRCRGSSRAKGLAVFGYLFVVFAAHIVFPCAL